MKSHHQTPFVSLIKHCSLGKATLPAVPEHLLLPAPQPKSTARASAELLLPQAFQPSMFIIILHESFSPPVL